MSPRASRKGVYLCLPSAAVKYIINRGVGLWFWGYVQKIAPHLKGHLGQEGELVLLKQCLAGVEKYGVRDALHQDGDAPLHVLHLVSLIDCSVEQHVEGLGNLK